MEKGIEILDGSKGYIDLAYPIYMMENQRKKFVSLLKTIFDKRVIIEKNVEMFRRDWRIGEKVLYPREWTAEEYLVLFESDSTKKAYESLGRSWYATELKDADWRYKLLSFCDKHGLDISKEDKLEIIKKFMKAQEEFKKIRKDLRKEKKELEERLKILDAPGKKEELAFLKKLKQIKDCDLDKIEKEKKQMIMRLKEIETELEKNIEEL